MEMQEISPTGADGGNSTTQRSGVRRGTGKIYRYPIWKWTFWFVHDGDCWRRLLMLILAGGFSLLAHYTRSRYLDDVESANEYGLSGSYMDAYHRSLDWGASGSDVPNHLVVTVLYEVAPQLANRWLAAALGGWRVGVVETVQSGPPFTVITSANTTNAFPAGPLRPNLLHDPALPAGQRTIARWFDTSAFVNPPAFAFGNAPRSVLRGPGVVTTDLTLEKSIGLKGPVKLDLRAEAFNLLNRANFKIPGLTLGAPDFGVISSARPARTIQLGARLSF